jgi:hypothetical protein
MMSKGPMLVPKKLKEKFTRYIFVSISSPFRARRGLSIPQRIPPRIQNIPFDIHPECNEKIDNDGRTHRKEGNINKVLADGGCGNAHSLANSGTNPKYMPLDKMLEALHAAKIDRIYTKNKRFKLKSREGIGQLAKTLRLVMLRNEASRTKNGIALRCFVPQH